MQIARRPLWLYFTGFILFVFCIAYFVLNTSSGPAHPPPQDPFKHPDHWKDSYSWSWQDPTRFRPILTNDSDPSTGGVDYCAGFPTYLLSSIQIVLKIGASEPPERLNAHINGVSRCIENLIVVSDKEHTVGKFHAHDILADLPPSYRVKNSDLATEYNPNAGDGGGHGTMGWKLDRYKFLPMAERAYQMNPTARFFVFLESDTYMVWDNLFRLLENLDPETPLYLGSPAPGRRTKDEFLTWFAYGGCGLVLSRAAARKLVAREVGELGEYTQPRISAQWEQLVRDDCCGDSVIGWALWNKEIPLSGLFPMFNPHSLQGIPYNSKMWCEPVISMHRTNTEDMMGLWEWEQTRDRTTPLLYADLIDYHRLGTFATRDDWDNADWDDFQEPKDSPAHASFETCGAACDKHKDCFQYNYHLKQCTFVRSIRLGSPRDPFGEGRQWTAEEKRYMAGWNTRKIEAWKRDHVCERAVWVKPSNTRIF